MELKIVTQFGENIFDMPGEKVIEILHHAMLYAEEKEKSVGASRQEPAGRTLIDGGVVGAAKDDEKIAEKQNSGETAITESKRMPEKAKEHTRNDSLFGANWRDAASESKVQREYGSQEEGYRGFLYIKCPVCGKAKGFCTKSNITDHICECGHKLHLEGLKPMYVHCECGKDFKYFTNMEDESFEYQCMSCGSPVDMRINKRGTAYVNLVPKRSGGGISNAGDLGIKAGGGYDRKYKKTGTGAMPLLWPTNRI